MNMTPSDWLYEVRNELQMVTSDNQQVFTMGVRKDMDDFSISVTLTDQGDYLEAYIVSEPSEGSDIEDSIGAVRDIIEVIGKEPDATVSTEKRNRWAEVHVEVEEDTLESL